MNANRNTSNSVDTGYDVMASRGSDTRTIDRRQFGRLVASASAAGLFAPLPAISEIANVHDVIESQPPNKMSSNPGGSLDGCPQQCQGPMVSLAIDDLGKSWCYLAMTTTLIGVPWMPDAVQVTYDGAIFTRHAELCFFYGDPLQPVLQRQKRWLDGWIPIVQYDWRSGDIEYEVEMFSSELEGFSEENTLQFVRVQMRNSGSQPTRAVFAAASRASGVIRRLGDAQFEPTWNYEISDGALYRDGEFVYSFPIHGVEVQAIAGHPYDQKFAGEKYSVTKRTAVGMARYAPLLAPGETVDLLFKMPRVPTRDHGYILSAQAADYRIYRERTIQFWQKLLGERNRITVTAEPLIEHAHRATAVHTLLATRTSGSQRVQTDGLPYPMAFLSAFPEYGRLYDTYGLNDYTDAGVHYCRKNLQSDGMFLDVNLIHGKNVLSSHGQAMAFLLNHALMAQDTSYAREIWPMIRSSVDLIRRDHELEPHGLMRASWPYDNEMIKGQWTCHNLWSLYALRAAIRVARMMDENTDADSWLKLHDSYLSSVAEALNASAASDGYIPTGLYQFLTGEAARSGFAEWQTDQDFENMLLAWPSEVLLPSDRRVVGTVNRLRQTKYREGIMTYRNGQRLHHYITVNSAMQDVIAGRDKDALLDTYHILMHCGSTFEGFENLVFPWADRVTSPSCPPPHAWGAAKINGLLRNLFVVELGGRYGLDEGQRDLRLFNVISPAWIKPGERIAVENARTEFGVVTASMQFRANGADVSITTNFHDQPRDIVLHIPYFIELLKFDTDATRSSQDGVNVRVSPDVKRIGFKWRQRPGAHRQTVQDILLSYRREPGFWKGKRSEMPTPSKGTLTPEEKSLPPVPLSFVAVRDSWRREYARRFYDFVQAGGKPVTIAAPPTLTEIGIGGGLATPPLPHHYTNGSANGGSTG